MTKRKKTKRLNSGFFLRDLFDGGTAGFGVEQHGFMRREHLLNAGDVGQVP